MGDALSNFVRSTAATIAEYEQNRRSAMARERTAVAKTYDDMPLPVHPCGPVCDCMPVIASLRVSKVGDRGDDLISPELQLFSICQVAHAEKRRVVKIVPDIDKTGREFSKRRVKEIIDDIRNGLAQEVWLWKWSRWGRNTQHSLNHIAQVEECGGQVRSSTENFTRETSTGKFTVGMMLQIAELQSDQISDGWKEAHSKREREGKSTTNSPRFGYYNSHNGYAIMDLADGAELPEDTTTVEADLKEGSEAWYLRDTYKRIVAGEHILHIAEEWNALGVKTTAAWRPNKPTDGKWTQQTLRLMLSTGFAAGWVRARKKPSAKTRRTARMDSFDKWRRGDWPSIITEKTWTDFKARIKANADKPAQLVWPKSPLSGLLICALCGPERGLTLTKDNNGKQQLWKCPRRRDNRDLHASNQISDLKARGLVMAWIDSVIEGGADVQAHAELIDKARRSVDTVADLDSQILAIEAELITAGEKVISGAISDDVAKAIRVKKEKELERLAGLRAEAELARSQSETDPLPMFTSMREAWPTLTPQYQHELLSRLVRGFVVWPHGSAERIVPVERWK